MTSARSAAGCTARIAARSKRMNLMATFQAVEFLQEGPMCEVWIPFFIITVMFELFLRSHSLIVSPEIILQDFFRPSGGLEESDGAGDNCPCRERFLCGGDLLRCHSASAR